MSLNLPKQLTREELEKLSNEELNGLLKLKVNSLTKQYILAVLNSRVLIKPNFTVTKNPKNSYELELERLKKLKEEASLKKLKEEEEQKRLKEEEEQKLLKEEEEHKRLIQEQFNHMALNNMVKQNIQEQTLNAKQSSNPDSLVQEQTGVLEQTVNLEQPGVLEQTLIDVPKEYNKQINNIFTMTVKILDKLYKDKQDKLTKKYQKNMALAIKLNGGILKDDGDGYSVVAEYKSPNSFTFYISTELFSGEIVGSYKTTFPLKMLSYSGSENAGVELTQDEKVFVFNILQKQNRNFKNTYASLEAVDAVVDGKIDWSESGFLRWFRGGKKTKRTKGGKTKRRRLKSRRNTKK